MKNALLLATALTFATASLAAAETYTLDPTHTNVVWRVNHLGFSYPDGKFATVAGTLTLDEKAPENSKVEATITTASIITGGEKFDAHLKSADFFNTEKFPTATFISTSVTRGGETKGSAKVVGNLTLLGITKPVTLDVKLNKIGEHPMSKKKTVGFSATTTIKRSEFGMVYGIPAVADDVSLTIETEASVQ
jgi:polyisoprenoid-binding protein YceI